MSKVRRIALAGLLLALGALGGAIGYYLAARPKFADLSFEPAQKNLGNVLFGEQSEVDFTLTNTGKESVMVDRISASCSCVAINFRPTELAPGKNLTIHAQATITSLGEKHEIVEAITFPPAARPVRARIQYHAERSLELDRNVFTIGEAKLTETTWPRELYINVEHCPRPATLKLGYRNPKTRMQYELVTERFDAGEKSIAIKVRPLLPHVFGYFQDSLELQATFKERTVAYPVTISGTILDDRSKYPGAWP